MVAEMTWEEMVGWRAYSEIEPFGERRADLRIGYAMARLATYLGGDHVRVEDFIVADVQDAQEREGEPAPKPTFDDVREAFFGSMGMVAPERRKEASPDD